MPYLRKRLCGRSRMIYERPPTIIWTGVGGIVWVGVAVYLMAHLGAFAFLIGGSWETPKGVSYEIPIPRLTWSDVEHLRNGGAITDREGTMLIDPSADSLLFIKVDSLGAHSLASTRPSEAAESEARIVAVVQPDRNASYSSVVRALDDVRTLHPDIDAVWISAPGNATPDN